MRACIFILLLFPLLIKARPVDSDLVKVRNLYYNASSQKERCSEFDSFITKTPQINSELLQGYRGMSYMLKARYSYNPISKLSYFNTGKNYLDKAISTAPDNIELRFLRFAVQTNAPGFLNYFGNINEDKNVIIRGYLISKDQDLKQRIKNYMVVSKFCSKQEKELFR